MNLELLKAFVAVAETGGITKAEHRIHRTQSTISQQIARLESDLSTVLFDRRKRTVQLTERGRQYLDYARRILALDQESRALIHDQDRFRVVRIGISDNYTRMSWADRLIAFTQANADVRTALKTDQSGVLQTHMDEGHLDITICNELNPPTDALAFRPAPLHWLAAEGATVHREHPLPLILYPPGCAYRTRALTALESAGIAWRIAFETPDWQSIRTATEKGMGVALLDNADGMKHVRPLGGQDGLPPVEPVYLTLRTRHLSEDDRHIQMLASTFVELIDAPAH
ncbi:LysR family transcriptional regulator [Magnetovibrio sp.]|uniref:LysR family transcriptional regulator n=1 Tax=Magnetovibrio sp. TaxID=2024836 RepID=UPI002F91F4A8